MSHNRIIVFLAVLAVIITVPACSTLSEEEKLANQSADAEKREVWAQKQKVCEDSRTGTWVCTDGSKMARKNTPWLYCGCAYNNN